MASPVTETPKPGEPPGSRTGLSPSRKRGKGGSRLGDLLFWVTVLGLLGGNAWYLYRDRQPDPNPRVAEALIDSGRLDEAEPMLREILRRSPHDGGARMLLARLLARRGKLVESGEEFGKVPFWWPAKPKALFLEGEAYNQAGLARKAEAAWRECGKDDPLHPAPELYYLTAIEAVIEIFAMQERWEDAREVAWSCYDRVPYDQRRNVVFMILRTYVQRVTPEIRAEKLRVFVENDPEDFPSRLALARAEFSLERHDEARRQIDICLRQNPESAEAWRTHLGMLKQLGRMDLLTSEVEKIPASCDGDSEIWGFRGLSAERTGDLKKAASCYAKEVELAPYSDEGYYRLALVQKRLGLQEEASKNLEKSKRIRDAESKLLAAYEAYSNAYIAKVPDPKAIEKATEQLAGICRSLGWTKIAEVL